MTTVVTGSTGHLGEALVRTLRADGEAVVGVDMRPGPCTDRVGRIEDVDFARDVLAGARSVLHAATLHPRRESLKPQAVCSRWLLHPRRLVRRPCCNRP
ncbi:MAG: NAD-dependent epimerase/dehydratase family protein, partial [Pseudomonadales bacterium]|nr:NAD-dependent epimerase/dehydratase family protein [Pseudomonadales bacterium]